MSDPFAPPPPPSYPSYPFEFSNNSDIVNFLTTNSGNTANYFNEQA